MLPFQPLLANMESLSLTFLYPHAFQQYAQAIQTTQRLMRYRTHRLLIYCALHTILPSLVMPPYGGAEYLTSSANNDADSAHIATAPS